MSGGPTIHASCVVVGEAGVLIRGASGAGKSSLALAIIDSAGRAGRFARLVADDRVRVDACNGRALASAPPALSGLVERRGLGIVSADHVEQAVIRLIVDIEPAPERMPEPAALEIVLEGVALPRIAVARGDSRAAELALFSLGDHWRRSCGMRALAFAARREKIGSSAPHAPSIRTDRAASPRGGQDPERMAFCAETA
jgi:hypothetical protein